MRAVVGYARGRWVAHPLTARRALQEGFACADAVLPGAARPAAPGRGRAARPGLWLDAERLERTALLLGCDPALGIVAGHMARLARGRDPARVSWLEAGSAASLAAVAGGTAHLAGLHLRDGETGEFNVPQAARALAATGGRGRRLLPLGAGVRRRPGQPQGRAHGRRPGPGGRAPGQPGARRRAAGPCSTRCCWGPACRRARCAATTARWRATSRWPAPSPPGAQTPGSPSRRAAEAYGLDFVPLVEVRFDVAIPADHLGHPAVALFLEALQTRALREELRALPGYDVDELGAVRAEVPAAA